MHEEAVRCVICGGHQSILCPVRLGIFGEGKMDLLSLKRNRTNGSKMGDMEIDWLVAEVERLTDQYDKLLSAKKVTVVTPAIPESEVTRYLQKLIGEQNTELSRLTLSAAESQREVERLKAVLTECPDPHDVFAAGKEAGAKRAADEPKTRAYWSSAYYHMEAERDKYKAALERIETAIRDYHFALDTRQHGYVALAQAYDVISGVLGLSWEYGAEQARRRHAAEKSLESV